MRRSTTTGTRHETSLRRDGRTEIDDLTGETPSVRGLRTLDATQQHSAGMPPCPVVSGPSGPALSLRCDLHNARAHNELSQSRRQPLRGTETPSPPYTRPPASELERQRHMDLLRRHRRCSTRQHINDRATHPSMTPCANPDATTSRVGDWIALMAAARTSRSSLAVR